MTAEATGTVEISVVVPVVERADDLVRLHAEVRTELEKLGLPYEFLFVIGGPFDHAFEQAIEIREADPRSVRVIRFARGVGEALALATGFDRARGRVVFTLPAYFDAAPTAIGALHDALEGGADLAFAARKGRRDSLAKRLQTLTFNRLVSLATGTEFSDIASGTRAVRREVLDEVHLYGDFHRFLPVQADRVGFAVREVPVDQHPEAHAPALYAPRTYLWRALDILSIFFLSRFTRRPLRLFGALGSVFGLSGAIILAVVGTQRLLGTPLAGRPILVLGTLLLGVGVQVFTIGLLGELLLFFHARDIRDYRVADVFEAEDPPLPAPDRSGAPED